MLKEFGYRDGNLYGRIKLAIESGLLTEDMGKWAHQVRIGANEERHEQQLHSLISKMVAEINKPQKSLGGKLKKLAFNSLVNTDDIQAQVPAFSKTIITLRLLMTVLLLLVKVKLTGF
jgi:hypothetical protein